MTYESLYRDLIGCVPEYKNRLAGKCAECHADESDGMHVVFGMVIVPFVAELLRACDDAGLKKVFAYFEHMAVSENADICEVLEFTVLEGLIAAGPGILQQCKKYMGPETIRSCLAIEQYIG